MHARNHAIREAKGKYILPVDGDDVLMPGFVAWAVNQLERDKMCLWPCREVNSLATDMVGGS